MPLFTVRDVVKATQGTLIGGDLGLPVSGVSIDSRSLRVGEAFFAIRGSRLDGHEFLADAASRGASAMVVHSLSDDPPPHVPVILVDDTTLAMGRLAAFHRSRFDIPVVAVTGSNGKTTTKEMTAAVLGMRWSVLKPDRSFNNQWGVPLTLLGIRPEHRAAVVELGTNHPGEIEQLARIARPTVGVVTTVASVHTEFLGSLEGVQREKAALVAAIPSSGFVILNADDPLVLEMAREARGTVITYGASPGARVRAEGEIGYESGRLVFSLLSGDGISRVELQFLGRHNVTNALAAASVGVALGFSLDEIVAGLESARPAPGRLVWRPAGQIRILDDSYNANPASVRSALATLAEVSGGARMVVALGDMLELGRIAREAHEEVGREAAAVGVAELVCLGPMARWTALAARAAGILESHNVGTVEDAVALLLKRLVPGDVLLVKGSRGMRMERVADALCARWGEEGTGERG